MSNTPTLLERNRQFASDYNSADMSPMPKLRMIIVCCCDSRVDPTHIFGLEAGEAVVIRNTGGRVTPEVVDEIGALAFMVANAEGATGGLFEVVLLQHTQCGAERFADPSFQQVLKAKTGVDVSSVAITDHDESLHQDVECLRSAPQVPGCIVVSGLIYDVKHGSVREVIAPAALEHQSQPVEKS